MNPTFALSALALASLAAVLPAAWRRLQLSAAKHPSLTGHSRMAKRVAAQVPGYSYGEARFFNSDGAPADVVAQRRVGLTRMAELFRAFRARPS
jgi:glutamate-1-semialdehyde 2,1-aminomutase